MREKRVWIDDINGFTVEIVNWGFGKGELDKWNYYIYFTPKNTPAEFWGKLLAIAPGEYSIHYFGSFLADLEWHGGITFAEFQRNSMQEICAIKAGCDYLHLWDEGWHYELGDLICDATDTIASALALFHPA